MNATAQRALALLFAALGLLAVTGSATAVAVSADRQDAVDQWSAIAGLGLFSAAVSLFWFFAAGRSSPDRRGSIAIPPAWLSFFVLIVVIAAGFALQFVDASAYVAAVFATVGFVAVGAFFLRLAIHWRHDRRLPLAATVLPGAWGFFAAPVILMLVQGAAVILVFVAIFAGIYIDNPKFELDPNLEQRISDYIEESGADATSTELPAIVETPTVALSIFSVVAIIAPLSEEIVKALGAILVLARRPVVTRSDAFLAAVAAGLGFALFEGMGYTLAAPASWHQIIVIRAPVVIMHLAATTIVVLGWYRMRETGRGFLPYFIAGTALHAGWNGLYVGFIYSLTGLESGSDPTAGQAASVVTVVLLLGALFIVGLAWYISAARKSGLSERPPTLAQESTERVSTSYAAILDHG